VLRVARAAHPSMTVLDRYIETFTLKALVLASAGLTLLFSLLELIDQLHDVGRGQYRLVDAVAYVALTAPGRLLQLMPVSMLLASLFGLGALASHNELTVMRGAGMSPVRIVWPVFKLAAATIVALFLMAQFVIPPTQQRAQTERLSRLSSASEPVRSESGLWAEGEHEYLNVRQFTHGNVPENIYIYEFASDGGLRTFIHAAGAEIRPDGIWLLSDVVRKGFDATGMQTERLPLLAWRSFLRPQQVPLLILPPESMQPVALYQYVRDLQRRGERSGLYAQELWAKIDIPLAMAAMILIALPFVLGPLRSFATGQRIMAGAMIGIVFTLVEQITAYYGLLSGLAPALTATLPSFVLAAVALYLFRRAHL
jgi:lipopolysaccharide export system permease protein